MKQSELPTLELELDYAVEAFIDENDRQPTLGEFQILVGEVHDKVDSAQEAYSEWKALGLFECAVCEKTHRHWAPQACRAAYNSGEF